MPQRKLEKEAEEKLLLPAKEKNIAATLLKIQERKTFT